MQRVLAAWSLIHRVYRAQGRLAQVFKVHSDPGLNLDVLCNQVRGRRVCNRAFYGLVKDAIRHCTTIYAAEVTFVKAGACGKF